LIVNGSEIARFIQQTSNASLLQEAIANRPLSLPTFKKRATGKAMEPSPVKRRDRYSRALAASAASRKKKRRNVRLVYRTGSSSSPRSHQSLFRRFFHILYCIYVDDDRRELVGIDAPNARPAHFLDLPCLP